MNIFRILTFYLVFFYGCGSSKNDGGDQADRAKDEKTTESKNNNQKTDVSKTEGSACLFNCSVPEELQFSFSDKRIDILENCSVRHYRLIDQGQYFVAFHISDCGSGYQLYSTKISYDLTAERSILLSNQCSTNSGKTNGFIMVPSDGKTLLVTQCQISTVNFKNYGILVSLIGEIDIERNLSDGQPFTAGAWNGFSKSFGLVTSDGFFRRFDLSLTMIGGSLKLDSRHVDSGLTPVMAVRDGNWFVVHSNTYHRSAFCSRISSVGVLGCSAVSSKIVEYQDPRVTLFDAFQAINAIYDSDILRGYTQSYFNSITCQIDSSNVVRPTSNLALKVAKKSFVLGPKYYGFLFDDSNSTLNLSIMSRSPLENKSVVAIMDGNDFSLGDPFLAMGYIFIPYTKDGLMFVKKSDKTVP